ncbi:unnamed protein product [Rotaria sordida]|uniref:Uncharacterized protein n=2 Tax=Rotaria sordida TaxID=392033 RepID=A0A814G985_9BILA|nr:unnamed protein product [Rotaria sordida]
MNGPSTSNGPTTNEQSIGKFQVINLDKLPVNTVNNHDDTIQQVSSIPDESGCPSRFQMIRVDRNFGRGRWKVNDYEPPENISTSIIPSTNTIENDSINIPNNSTFTTATIPNISATIPTVITGDSNVASSATLAATAASAAAAAATAFQQQQQQMALQNASTLVPSANVPPPAGLLHAYPPGPLPNQPYLLPNHHPQFGYYPFYPTPYPPYATSWAAAAAALNPFLQPPTLAAAAPQPTTSSLPTTANINDPIRLSDTVSDINGENTVISSANFPNPTNDHIQNAQLAAAVAAAAPFLYATHPSHSPFVPQASSTTSPYATIPSYNSVPPLPTIIPRNQASQTFPTSHTISNNINDTQSSYQAPILTSPKHDTTKNLIQQSSLISTTKSKPLATTVVNYINNELSRPTQVTDLISSSPLITTSETIPSSLISPININVTNPSTTSLSDIWTYTTNGSPLNLTQTAQTAAVTAAAAIGLLNNENSQNTEIANEILKELTTPTKQNNTTDIDNKISAAMNHPCLSRSAKVQVGRLPEPDDIE